MTAAWTWIKAKAKWLVLAAFVALLAVAVVLAYALRSETAKRKLQEALAKARGAALEARHLRDAEVQPAREAAEAEHEAAKAEHDAAVTGPESVGDRLDAAAGDPDAELDEVNTWLRSRKP